MIKQVLKSRTVQFSMALAVLSVLNGFIGYIPSPLIQAITGSIIAVCIVLLRAVTTAPLSEK